MTAWGGALVFALGALFVAGAARAQSTGIAVERFTPAAGPSAFAQVEGAAVPAVGQLWFSGAIFGIGGALSLKNAVTGEGVAAPVRHRATLDVGAELGLWRQRLSIGVGLPIAVYQDGDRLQRTGAAGHYMADIDAPLAQSALGDIRLRIKAQLLPGEAPVGLAILFEATAPGGGQHDFVATSGPTVAPRLIGSFRYRWLTGAVNLAVRFLPERVLYETVLHDQLEGGAALGAVLPVRRIGLALYAETFFHLNLVSPSYEHGTEARGALRIGWIRGAIDLGGGAGFGTLAPSYRAFLLLRTWFGASGVSGCPTKMVTF